MKIQKYINRKDEVLILERDYHKERKKHREGGWGWGSIFTHSWPCDDEGLLVVTLSAYFHLSASVFVPTREKRNANVKRQLASEGMATDYSTMDSVTTTS